MKLAGAIPSLGYPSQSKAVVALYEQGNTPVEIARRLEIKRESVHRALFEHRERNGIIAPSKRNPKPVPKRARKRPQRQEAGFCADDCYDPNKARREAFLRAQRGARLTVAASP